MVLLRVFSRPNVWFDAKPSLSTLFRSFDINEKLNTVQTASVFRTNSALEELEVASALTQKDQSTPAKQFGIRINPADCRAAGIEIDATIRGTTGVESVDMRHVDLKGNRDQFRNLITSVLARLWEGHDCIRTFPEHMIAGQLALFQKLTAGIDAEARERCRISLSKIPRYIGQREDDDDKIQILGELDKTNPPVSVVGERSISEYIRSSSSGNLYQKIKMRLENFLRGRD